MPPALEVRARVVSSGLSGAAGMTRLHIHCTSGGMPTIGAHNLRQVIRAAVFNDVPGIVKADEARRSQPIRMSQCKVMSMP